jgi:hypothetical protein
MKSAPPEAVLRSRKPMRATFLACCACATAPHIAKVRTRAAISTNFRFWILEFGLSNRSERIAVRTIFVMSSFPNPKSKIANPNSSNHPIRSGQYVRWNRHAGLFCRLQIDHQLKLGRLLNRQVARLGAFQDLVHINSSAFVTRSFVR